MLSAGQTFGSLPIGTVFEFDHSGLSCTSFAHGPWRKVSTRRYAQAHPTGERGAAYRYRVGTIKVKVIQAAEPGQRYVACGAYAEGGRA